MIALDFNISRKNGKKLGKTLLDTIIFCTFAFENARCEKRAKTGPKEEESRKRNQIH